MNIVPPTVIYLNPQRNAHMRYCFIVGASFLLSFPGAGLHAQVTTGSNFVIKTSINAAGVYTQSQVDNLATEKRLKTINYIDGLGRPIQTVQMQVSAERRDLVTPIEYDNYGRLIKKYLPYADLANTTYGSLRVNGFADQGNFYNSSVPDVAKDPKPYDQSHLEFSPLNRVLETGGTGQTWQPGGGHAIKARSSFNTIADAVKKWTISSLSGADPIAGDYAAGELFKSIATDEQGKQTIEFRDREGKVILKKIQLVSNPSKPHLDWLCTYYVYDDFNNLRFVIPPKAVAALASSWSFNGLTDVKNELCFIYEYDERGRMVLKKIPGAGAVEMAYDVRDRIVFSRDGNLNSAGKWLVNYYDAQNRPVMTAYYMSNSTRQVLQNSMNAVVAGSSNISYTFPGVEDLTVAVYDGRNAYQARKSVMLTDGFSTGSGASVSISIDEMLNDGTQIITANNPLPGVPDNQITPLKYTFYDDYSYTGAYSPESQDFNAPKAGSSTTADPVSTYSAMTRGQVTGTKVRVLGTDQWLTTTTYYTEKLQPLQIISGNINGGKDIATNLYDFEGKLLSTYNRYRNPRSSITPETSVLTVVNYDHAGRVLNINKQLNDVGPLKVISQNRYNTLGQLVVKTLGNNLDSLKYEYNIRGWLLGVNRNYVKTASGNYFGFDLGYDQAGSAIVGTNYNLPRYDGGVSGTIWRSHNDDIGRKYDFSYDNIGRLQYADFNQKRTGDASWMKNLANFTVSNLRYDEAGNILSMTQRGLVANAVAMVDSLKYGYASNSNKLSFVTDRANNTGSTLGDFKEINNNETIDYNYDLNGNLVKDNNKNITAITYNHLNLPELITIGGKGGIDYLYDADGVKLRKTVVDNTVTPAKTTITDYLSGGEYKNDSLQFIGHEEGRIRMSYKASPGSFVYDYFEKDNLGNVRVVLTEETGLTTYLASMEASRSTVENATFSNIEQTRVNKPVGYPEDNSTGSNSFVALLSAKDGVRKIGPSIVLKVMAGDTVQVSARAFYKSGPGKEKDLAIPATDVLNAVMQALIPGTAGSGIHLTTPDQSSLLDQTITASNYQRLKEKDPDQNRQDKPKAYLNFVLFDEQFKLVEENSGVRQVKGEPDQLQVLGTEKMPVSKSGYLYVYTSNESADNVFFDNVMAAQAVGPLLEVTHYYPFGLTMEGISSNALKGSNYPENKKKFASQDLDQELDLNWYQFKYRSMDPQIGRFVQIDPLSNKYPSNSTYAYAENKVTMGTDLEGLELLPFNSAWFRAAVSSQPIYGTNLTSQQRRVDVVSSNVPAVFKDESGALMFSASSVGVTPDGLLNSSTGPTIRPGSGLPASPDWPFKQGDPDATGSTGGWRIGNDLERNKEYADKGSGLSGLPQEGHNWITLYRSAPIWNALVKLRTNVDSYDKAASIAGNSFSSPQRRADLTNFINDGKLPSLDLNNLKGSLQSGIDIMQAGMKAMDKNGIEVNDATRKTFESYKTILEFIDNVKRSKLD
jgi:RHS repeat-associated protein